MSGLLNAIDGVVSQEGSLLFLTTNHPQLLPARLVRSGRIDRRAHFGLASPAQVRGLYRLYYGADQPQMEQQFVDGCPSDAVSCSDVVGCMTMHKTDQLAALAELRRRIEQDAS